MSELPAGCVPFDEDLSALIDEELSPQREVEVRAHLDGCDRCAQQLQALCNVDLALASVATPPVAPELSRSLNARIAALDPPAGEPFVRTAPPPPQRRWLGGRRLSRIALAAGVLLAAWLVLRGGEVPEPAPRVAEQPAPDPVPQPVLEEPAVELQVAEETPVPPELPDEDLEMLLELEGVEDLDLIANLELLETLVDLERGAG